MTQFPVPPRQTLLVDEISEEVAQGHAKMGVPLDIFQAAFYSALGTTGSARMLDLVRGGKIGWFLGYGAVIFLGALTLWLTVRYAFVLADLARWHAAKYLPERLVESDWAFKSFCVLLIVIVSTINIGLGLYSNCILLNECTSFK